MIGWSWATAAGVMAALAIAEGVASAESPAETAALFGARPDVQQLSLSPDGTKIAFLAPTPSGQGTIVYTVAISEASNPRPALSVNGAPDRLRGCRWVLETRLVCTVYGVLSAPGYAMPLGYSRIFAVDAVGGNQRLLSNVQQNRNSAVFSGGRVIDWLPDQGGKIMMMRDYQNTMRIGSNVGSNRAGTGVDVIDTRDAGHVTVEQPRPDAVEFITDGRGEVRIAGFSVVMGQTEQNSGRIDYRYRSAGSRDWHELGDVDTVYHNFGFDPWAVDPDKNVAYGLRKIDGRLALFAKALDATGTEALVLSRPDVDIDAIERIGRKQRVVGASFITDRRNIVYFDPAIRDVADSLRRALPNSPLIGVVDANADESKLLIVASADNDPGHYYLLDRARKKLQILMAVRPQLEGRNLALTQPISYIRSDGAKVPAYLTAPSEGPKVGIPAIVLPHGGPAARDEWGFDWLVQFYAARGYAVLQPQFRGSAGFGDAYFLKNGFQSWRAAIADVADAGRWLVAQGIADPAKLAIVGWSYGGYAALQSTVIAPGLFKAVVAIAPVTDLALLKDQHRDFADYRLNADYIGNELAVVRDGSPAQMAAQIKVPVLLAHGTADRNVSYKQSTLMEARLRAAGGYVELLTFPDLDHDLDDSIARTKLLERSDAFIRAAIGQ